VTPPAIRFGLLSLALAVILAVGIWQLGVDPLLSWLISVTVITFLAYGYDKASAGSQRVRIPEVVLLALAFAGGTLGAFAGMQVFHHKTRKSSFRLKFWLVAAVQVGLIAVYFVMIRQAI
jgi:uncharacterized membrane protein YsdA (DUF1294 family)